jgi:hypothetical protein
MMLTALLFALTLLLHNICQSNASLLYRRESYTWRASLDSCTGVATSLERSVFAPKEAEFILPSKGDTITFARHEFFNYSRFLQKVSLTLGLCRVLHSTEHNSDLYTSFLPINLLSFGKPIFKTNNNTVCCVKIPIVGGFLAKINPNSADHGCLSFTWHQEKNNITLVTEIAGNYQPTLAGSRIPVPLWRNILYSSTQRLFHEYVMWRFHGFILKEFEKQCLNNP